MESPRRFFLCAILFVLISVRSPSTYGQSTDSFFQGIKNSPAIRDVGPLMETRASSLSAISGQNDDDDDDGDEDDDDGDEDDDDGDEDDDDGDEDDDDGDEDDDDGDEDDDDGDEDDDDGDEDDDDGDEDDDDGDEDDDDGDGNDGSSRAAGTTIGPLVCDFDGDGNVGFPDFFLLADAFGSTEERFDLDGSGLVDFPDFFLFADLFAPSARAKLLELARESIGLPDGPQLHQNTPNPFNSETVLSYILPEPGPARLEILTVTGQRVRVLSHGDQEAGYHRFYWDGLDDAGMPLASGIYLYNLATAEGTLTRKLVLLR